MKCESCQQQEVEIREEKDNGTGYYLLCKACHERLLSRSLRPLEFFNLAAIHRQDDYYLHPDFYSEYGKAEQPLKRVKDARKLPFPKLVDIKEDLTLVVNYACVEYFLSPAVLEALKVFRPTDVIDCLEWKLRYNDCIDYKLFEIAANLLGRKAEGWIKEKWQQRTTQPLAIYAEAIAKCFSPAEAFTILTSESEKLNDKSLHDSIEGLLYLQTNQSLDWIEHIKHRIENVHTNWGVLAAASGFSWAKADQWLSMGRPLSLIALDALYFCTTQGERENQAMWLRENPPGLMEPASLEIMIEKLKSYQETDKGARTRITIQAIIHNLSPIE